MSGGIFSSANISAGGLSAERLRMEVIANNLANAHSTRTPEGGAYRRQQVVFAAELDGSLGSSAPGDSKLAGVRVLGIEPDMGELPRVYQPGHPDADENGMVTMPNVSLAKEMVDLITANRGYEANLKVLRSFRDMMEQALSLLRR